MKKQVTGQYFLENHFPGKTFAKRNPKSYHHDSKAPPTVFIMDLTVLSGNSYNFLLICYSLIANYGRHLLIL